MKFLTFTQSSTQPKYRGSVIRVFFSIGSTIAALLLCVIAQSSQAAVSCGYFNGSRGFTGTMALQVSTITVPRDAPLGTRIYMQAFNQAGTGAELQCDTSTATLKALYNINGNLTNTNSSANAYYAGKIYATGVPGIGVAWFAGQGGDPVTGIGGVGAVGLSVETGTVPGTGCTPGSPGTPVGGCRSGQLKLQNTASVVLIKTGPIGTGTIIGNNLGKMVMSAVFNDSTAYVVASLGLTGNINIVAQTCQTPDVTVALGSYKTSVLTGIGSTTPQVNFVIPLTGCPGFPGYYGAANPVTMEPASSQTQITNAGTPIPNTISIRIDPVVTPIDAGNGVLSLTAGAGTATGVGLQLLNSTGEPRALSKNQLLNVALDANTKAVNISLGARYLQTATTVTAGKANAVATYTIIYQ